MFYHAVSFSGQCITECCKCRPIICLYHTKTQPQVTPLLSSAYAELWCRFLEVLSAFWSHMLACISFWGSYFACEYPFSANDSRKKSTVVAPGVWDLNR